MAEHTFKAQIAKHLKALRQQQHLSLDAAAKATGVSKAMLGQIERQESSPTVVTLWKIAHGLDSSFSAFFASEAQLCSSEYVFPHDPEMQITTIFPYQVDTRFEMFEITLTNHHQQNSSAHSAGVIEHILVLSGQLDVWFDDSWHSLFQGDTIRFNANVPHAYKAVSKTVSFQNIVCYTN